MKLSKEKFVFQQFRRKS